MHWGLLALVFVISMVIGAGATTRKQRRAAKPPEELN